MPTESENNCVQKYWEMCRKDVFMQDSYPIYTDEGMAIHINTDEAEGKERVNYFKVFNAKTWSSATKVCRISFLEPTYISKENRDGCSNWVLNADEKKKLIKVLKSLHHWGVESNFEAACGWCNEMNRDIGEPLPEDAPMPDYSLLPEE